jgi:precorrin-6Y C5,15-methyltransferase (decarboxylating)
VNKIHIIGIGFRPLDNQAKDSVLNSDIIIASNRLLDVFKRYKEYKKVKDKIVICGNVYEILGFIEKKYRRKKISLLAAGDPMFFGIGRLVIERFGRDVVEVYPDLSSIQVAFSRIRETSNNALLISLHGGPDPEKRRKLEYKITDLPWLLEQYEKIAILTDGEIAKTILKSHISNLKSQILIYVCEKLGYPEERITKGTPQDIAEMSFEHPNVVIIKKNRKALCVTSNEFKENKDNTSRITHYDFRFGLKEDEISHLSGLITKDEVRAVTIHKLRLPQKGTFWDIGAGSGSVSIEIARLYTELKIYAIEKAEEQTGYLRNNIDRFAISNIEIIYGEAPEVLRNLPGPHRVFIGGSGDRLYEIISTVSKKMSKGIIVANATTIDTLNEAVQCLEKNNFKVDISEVSISRSKTIGQKRHMSALNPVFIISGEKS